MMFLPYERLTLQTYLSPEEAHQRLAEVVEPRKMFRWFGAHKPYQGEINGNQFTVSRIIHYRNSFLPIVKGDIRPDLGGSSINLVMHPHPLVIVFMLVWFGMAGLIFLPLLSGLIAPLIHPGATEPVSGFVILFPLGFLLFGYVLVMGGFKFETLKAKAFFRQLFAGR